MRMIFNINANHRSCCAMLTSVFDLWRERLKYGT